MRQHTHSLRIATRGKGLYEFTREVDAWVRSTGVGTGLLTIFVQHTSASLVIQENADPDVCVDLENFFERTVPKTGGSIVIPRKGRMTCLRTSARRSLRRSYRFR